MFLYLFFVLICDKIWYNRLACLSTQIKRDKTCYARKIKNTTEYWEDVYHTHTHDDDAIYSKNRPQTNGMNIRSQSLATNVDAAKRPLPLSSADLWNAVVSAL